MKLQAWGAMVVLLVWCGAAAALTPQEELHGTDRERYQHLINELRCLVCQNQTIADSNAPLAQDLRDQVRVQIEAGKSDAEIVDYVTARYGDFVLYRPPFKATTWLLWLGPFGLLLLGIYVVSRLFVRRRASAPAKPVDAERLRQLLDEERP